MFTTFTSICLYVLMCLILAMMYYGAEQQKRILKLECDLEFEESISCGALDKYQRILSDQDDNKQIIKNLRKDIKNLRKDKEDLILMLKGERMTPIEYIE